MALIVRQILLDQHVVGEPPVPLRYQGVVGIPHQKNTRSIFPLKFVGILFSGASPVWGIHVCLHHKNTASVNVFTNESFHSHYKVTKVEAGTNSSGSFQETSYPGITRTFTTGKCHCIPFLAIHKDTVIF